MHVTKGDAPEKDKSVQALLLAKKPNIQAMPDSDAHVGIVLWLSSLAAVH